MILPIEKQVCSLELSERLKELGIKQESYFYWCIHNQEGNGGLPIYPFIADIIRIEQSFFYPKEKYSAFTVSELGEMLPIEYVTVSGYGAYSTDTKVIKYWLCYYDPDGMENNTMEIKEADSRAKMVIYLIENNLISDEWKKQYLKDR